jgi:B9 domain-containing protein 2
MPSVHILGQILGASGFAEDKLFCKYKIIYDHKSMRLTDGDPEDQTQLSSASAIGQSHSFGHPVDLHFACTGLEGWPKIMVEVWSHDSFGRNVLAGYGCCYVPTSPGMHHVDCVTWLPSGSMWDRLKATFLGTSPSLNHPEIVYSDTDRLELNTHTSGTIHLDLQILLLDFKHHGVEFVSETNKHADLRMLGARAADKLHSENRTADIGRYLAS